MTAAPASPPRAGPAREPLRAAGALFTTPSLAVQAAVLAVSAGFSQAGLALLAGLFLATALLSRLWARLSLAGVQADRQFKETRVFPGERIECALTICNRKPLPVPWIQVEFDLQEGIRPETAERAQARGAIRRCAALLWYRRVRWTLQLVGRRRGYYPIGPLKLASGDLLGLYTRSCAAGAPEALIVYPRLFPFDLASVPSLHPMGEFRAARRVFEDPTHIVGVREYRCGDSLTFIHWKATARRGAPHVKVLAATTAFKLAIFLDVESFRPDGAQGGEDFERAISLAGSIAAAVSERADPVGLFVNTRLADTGQPAAIAPAAGGRTLGAILETLAKVTAASSGPPAAFLESQKPRLTAGTTLVLIAGRPTDGLPLLAAGLKEAGFRTAVLLIGEHDAPGLPAGIFQRRISRAQDPAAFQGAEA